MAANFYQLFSRCWAFLQLFLLHHCSSSDILIQPSLLGNFEFPLSLTRDEPGLNLVTVSRTLSESGFHRTLLTEVSLPSEVVSNVRSVAIVENITSSQYVDIDQLSLTGKPQVIASEHMDTEKPATLSSNHILLVYPTISNHRVTVGLPIHFRYQASCDSQYIPVTIPPPLLLYTLREGPGHDHPSDRVTHFPCNSTTSKLCEWHHLGYRDRDDEYCAEEQCMSDRENPLVAQIPCGGRDSVLLVVSLTVLVTLGASLYVCAVITSVSIK